MTIHELRSAAILLLDKLDEVSEATLGIFSVAQIHGAIYNGPTYEEEYDLLRSLTNPTDSAPRTSSHHVRSDLSGTPTPMERKWLDMIEKETK